MESPLVLLALFVAAALGGALNSVAGGGSFLTFPTLLFAGVASRDANATSTVALWPGSVASIFGYREELKHEKRLVWILGAVSAVGGLIGALLLVYTRERTFARMVPYLLAAATLIFAFGPLVSRHFRRHSSPDPTGQRALLWMTLLQLPIAVYGGYFGGGIGILMLASMAAMGMEDLNAMNGLKAILGTIINGVALSTFILKGLVVWPLAVLMIGGAIVGGYAGARLGRRVNRTFLRGTIITVGVVLTVYFFVKSGA